MDDSSFHTKGYLSAETFILCFAICVWLTVFDALCVISNFEEKDLAWISTKGSLLSIGNKLDLFIYQVSINTYARYLLFFLGIYLIKSSRYRIIGLITAMIIQSRLLKLLPLLEFAGFNLIFNVLILLLVNEIFSHKFIHNQILKYVIDLKLGPFYLIKIQLIAIYFSAFVSKITAKQWMNGDAFYYILLDPFTSRFYLLWSHVSFLKTISPFLTWGGMILELVIGMMLSISVIFSITPYLGVALGVIFHLLIYIFLDVSQFSFLMIALLMSFLVLNGHQRS